MKKLVSLILALILALSMAAFAEEIDTSGMNSSEWFQYEFHMDYSTLYSDITSYDHQYIRDVIVDHHWQTYFAVQEGSELSEEERLAKLAAWHDARVATPKLNDPEEKRVYLWPKGAVPSITEYTENPGYMYMDNPDFEPYMLECLVSEDVTPKGAVLLFAGGGFNYRSNIEEGIEVANAFNALGYQCFIVNYRISPYTRDEAALDGSRAVRYVRANADKYRIDPDTIAAAGFSAGGFVVSSVANNYYGDINASALVEGYAPDELDGVSADLNAVLCIYSFLPTELVNPAFPASFVAVGGADGMFSGAVGAAVAAINAGVTVELHTFSGAPHGFGAGTDAAGITYENAALWTELADAFMTDVYSK